MPRRPRFDWDAVETAFGRSGSIQPRDVFRFGKPRTDLNVTSDGVHIAPALAHFFALSFGGPVMLPVRVYLYGDSAADVARNVEATWQTWLGRQFPPISPGRDIVAASRTVGR